MPEAYVESGESYPDGHWEERIDLTSLIERIERAAPKRSVAGLTGVEEGELPANSKLSRNGWLQTEAQPGG
jgi:hypothetical protein